MERLDLVLEGGRGEVAADGSLPCQASPGRTPPIGHEHGETLVRQPLRGEERAPRSQHALRVWPSVRIEQDGELRFRSPAAREEQYEPEPEDSSMAEMDALLDKIARSGIGSLTPNERRILDRARDRLLRESK